MKNKIIFFISMLFCLSSYGQSLTDIKHVEMISDTTNVDSVGLLNKTDIDIINTVFAKRDKLDSLAVVQDSIISNLYIDRILKESIISTQDSLIQSSMKLIKDTKVVLEDNRNLIEAQKQEIQKQRKWKQIFGGTSGGLLAALIIILCL